MFSYQGISFSKLSREDLNLLLDLKQESWFGTHSVSILNGHDQQKWFESLDADAVSPKNLVLVGSTDVEKIGIFKVLNIHWVNRTADVGWDVFRSMRGRGFGKKIVTAGCRFCFRILNLRRLTAEILDNNQISQKCAQAAGFQFEGTKRQAIERNGVLHDSLIFGAIREQTS